MSERVVKSYDPLAYYVTKRGDLDPKLIEAYEKKDNAAVERILSQARFNFDIYICVSKSPHAFVLCSPLGENVTGLDDDPIDDPFRIPGHTLCWAVELVFDNEQLKTYKVTKTYQLFKDLEKRIHRSSYIARYNGTSAYALDLAAWRAAPTRYGVLLNDCVEFAKMFCEELQAYCTNYGDIKSKVQENIKRATATGLSVEKLSRQHRLFGISGNLSLGGADASSFLSSRNGWFVLFVLIVFVLISQIIVALLVYKWMSS